MRISILWPKLDLHWDEVFRVDVGMLVSSGVCIEPIRRWAMACLRPELRISWHTNGLWRRELCPGSTACSQSLLFSSVQNGCRGKRRRFVRIWSVREQNCGNVQHSSHVVYVVAWVNLCAFKHAEGLYIHLANGNFFPKLVDLVKSQLWTSEGNRQKKSKEKTRFLTKKIH